MYVYIYVYAYMSMFIFVYLHQVRPPSRQHKQVAIQQQERHPYLGITDTTLDIDRTEESDGVESEVTQAEVTHTTSARLSVNDVGARL